MMIRLFFSLFIGISLIACDGSAGHVNMGNLSDYEVGKVVLYKPADVPSIRITKVLGQNGKKYVVSESVNNGLLYLNQFDQELEDEYVLISYDLSK